MCNLFFSKDLSIKAKAAQIFVESFGTFPNYNNAEEAKEFNNIYDDLEYLYNNMAQRIETRRAKLYPNEEYHKVETETIPVLPSLYWIETIREYDIGESFKTESNRIVSCFEDAIRIMKEIMHDKNDYNENGILKYVSVEIYETTWKDGELIPTFPVMKYVDAVCKEPGKGNLYHTEKTIIEEDGTEKEIAVYINNTEGSLMKYIKSGATVSIHQKNDSYVIYKISTGMSTFYYGVEIPRKNRKSYKIKK